jgi:two-component system, LuxR family, response regulator FixJ
VIGKGSEYATMLETNSHEKVYVVDDDVSVLASVKAILAANGYEATCFSNVKEFLADFSPYDIGCVVTDLQMPGQDGLALQKRLTDLGSTLAIVFATGFATVPTTVQVMEQGAITLLEKPYDSVSLLNAVSRAISHSSQMFKHRKSVSTANAQLSLLTDEERKVMECVVQGLPNKQICRVLDMSLRTVERRRQTAIDKLGITSAAEFAVILATATSHPTGK